MVARVPERVSVVAVAAALVLPLTPRAGAADPAPDTLRVHVQLKAAEPMSRFDERRMIAEVERIWARYGVTFTWARWDATVPAPPGSLTLMAQFDDRVVARRTRDESTFGVAIFTDGVPHRLVAISPSAVRRMAVHALVHAPAAASLNVYPRLLGRALAHELAHVLLETDEHTETGLLRSRFTVLDALDTSLDRLGLDAHGERRLASQKAAQQAALVASGQ